MVTLTSRTKTAHGIKYRDQQGIYPNFLNMKSVLIERKKYITLKVHQTKNFLLEKRYIKTKYTMDGKINLYIYYLQVKPFLILFHRA